jgi:hypothetical protein
MNTLTAEKRDLKTKAKKLRKEGYRKSVWQRYRKFHSIES